MRWLDFLASLVFISFAAVQINDPDALPWILIYGGTGALSLVSYLGHTPLILLNFWLLVCLLPALPLLGDLFLAPLSSFSSFGMADRQAERARESMGILIAACWTVYLRRRAPQKSATTALLLVLLTTAPLIGCG